MIRTYRFRVAWLYVLIDVGATLPPLRSVNEGGVDADVVLLYRLVAKDRIARLAEECLELDYAPIREQAQKENDAYYGSPMAMTSDASRNSLNLEVRMSYMFLSYY